jgi:hypothetical protein
LGSFSAVFSCFSVVFRGKFNLKFFGFSSQNDLFCFFCVSRLRRRSGVDFRVVSAGNPTVSRFQEKHEKKHDFRPFFCPSLPWMGKFFRGVWPVGVVLGGFSGVVLGVFWRGSREGVYRGPPSQMDPRKSVRFGGSGRVVFRVLGVENSCFSRFGVVLGWFGRSQQPGPQPNGRNR